MKNSSRVENLFTEGAHALNTKKTMYKIIVILGVVGSCLAGFELGDHGLTLGEISLDHEGLGSSIGLGDSGGWDSDIDISSFGGHGGHGGNFIPVVKTIGIPVAKKIPILVPQPAVQESPQPYPFIVPIAKPVPFEVEKQVFSKVEKKVPTPVEKIIPIKIEKHVPFHVVKPVPVPVVKHIPIKIPIYKTIVHRVKGH